MHPATVPDPPPLEERPIEPAESKCQFRNPPRRFSTAC